MMHKIKNIHEVYNQELFNLMEKERKNFQKEDFYDQLAIDGSDHHIPLKEIHQHLYCFYLMHLREENVLVCEIFNKKLQQVEVAYGMSRE